MAQHQKWYWSEHILITDDIYNASVQDTLFGRDSAMLVKGLRTGGDDGQD